MTRRRPLRGLSSADVDLMVEAQQERALARYEREQDVLQALADERERRAEEEAA